MDESESAMSQFAVICVGSSRKWLKVTAYAIRSRKYVVTRVSAIWNIIYGELRHPTQKRFFIMDLIL